MMGAEFILPPPDAELMQAAPCNDERRVALANSIRDAYLEGSHADALDALVLAMASDSGELPLDEAHAMERDVRARRRGALAYEAQLGAMVEAAADVLTAAIGSRYRGWEYAEALCLRVLGYGTRSRETVEELVHEQLAMLRRRVGLEITDEQATEVARAIASEWRGVGL